MKKKLIIAGISVLVPSIAVWALVTITAQPTSLVTEAIKAPASSEPIGLFKIGLSANEGETLSSISVTVNDNGASGVIGTNLANLSVYRDDGDTVFEVEQDILAATQTAVNIGSVTTIPVAADNSLAASTTFFVALSTAASWSDAAPADSITVSLATDGVVTSANSPTVTAATTASITADTTGPVLTSVVASDTGGNNVKEAGDSIIFTFGEATNKPALTPAELATTFTLSGGHSFLDGLSVFSSQSWNDAGTQFTLVISANTSLPTVEVGDTITVAGSLIQDAVGNIATGIQTITGAFANDTTGPALTSAVAADTGSALGLNAGDTVVLTFNEATNKPVISAANINGTLVLNNSHTWLDGAVALGTAAWNDAGTQLTVALTTGTAIPTIVVGDTVTVAGTLIKDLASNNATGSVTLTGNFGIQTDTTGPTLNSATAYGTGSANGKDAGDTIVLVFNEVTNKATINAANVNTVLALNNTHSWLDGAGALGGAAWNDAGTHLTITLSAATTLPTVSTGDIITVAGSLIQDVAGNNATGSRIIIGSFTKIGDDDDNDNDKKDGKICRNGLQNGKLYRQVDSDTVYLAAACKLKVFNGAAVGKAQGKKFLNILNWNGDDDDDDEENVQSQSNSNKDKGNRGRGNDDDED
ncbi:MAG TPA: hypothetical protein DEA87_02210 [Candidatus Veblenbacteria bacterium]|nr:hypothetical protein [Candidatus Veblenbacteria bacterium]HCM45223.1 hypothetical protein [Candidatus Veblenbacteria bacterium]